jgi:hypothetical protein
LDRRKAANGRLDTGQWFAIPEPAEKMKSETQKYYNTRNRPLYHSDIQEIDMPSFQQLFIKSKGQPVEYNGQTIRMVDHLKILDGQILKVVFESVNADWRQGVCLTTDGGFVVNNQSIKKSVALWHDTAPSEVMLRVQTKKGECWVKNVWDIGNGVMESWHNGAAMIVEEIACGRRYKCNDGQPDDDFTDIVFRIELLK